MSKAGERMLIHRVPVYDREGGVTRARYFPTVTEAKQFAIEQMKGLGLKGYTIESIPGYNVCDLLEEHVPLPEWYKDVNVLKGEEDAKGE